MRKKHIKMLLIQQDVKQQEIADKLGLSKQAVSRVISGKDRSRRVEQAIADTLNLSHEDLWESGSSFFYNNSILHSSKKTKINTTSAESTPEYDKLYALLDKKGLSLNCLAKNLDVHRTHLSKVVNGHIPGTMIKKRINEFLGESVF